MLAAGRQGRYLRLDPQEATPVYWLAVGCQAWDSEQIRETSATQGPRGAGKSEKLEARRPSAALSLHPCLVAPHVLPSPAPALQARTCVTFSVTFCVRSTTLCGAMISISVVEAERCFSRLNSTKLSVNCGIWLTVLYLPLPAPGP